MVEMGRKGRHFRDYANFECLPRGWNSAAYTLCYMVERVGNWLRVRRGEKMVLMLTKVCSLAVLTIETKWLGRRVVLSSMW